MRNREVKNDLKIFSMNIRKYGISIIQMGKAIEGAGLGRIIRNSVLDMLNLKYLLNVQVEKSKSSCIYKAGFWGTFWLDMQHGGYQHHTWDLKQCDQGMPTLKDWKMKEGEHRRLRRRVRNVGRKPGDCFVLKFKCGKCFKGLNVKM